MAVYLALREHYDISDEDIYVLFGDTVGEVGKIADRLCISPKRYVPGQYFGCYFITLDEAEEAQNLDTEYLYWWEVKHILERKALEKAEETMHTLVSILENYRDEFAKDDAELQSIIDKIKNENMKNPPENLE